MSEQSQTTNRFPTFAGLVPQLGRVKQARQAGLLLILSTATERNLPLVPALEALQDSHIPGSWKRKLAELTLQLELGTPLETALQRIPGLLPPDILLMIQTGAESGNLALALREGAESMAVNRSTQVSSLGIGLVYLAAVMLLMTMMLTFIMIFIIPKFKKIFEDFGTDLPAATKTLINFSDFVGQFAFIFLPLGVFVLVLLVMLATGYSLYRAPFKYFYSFCPRALLPDILRNLALAVDTSQPLPRVLSRVARHHPVPVIRSKSMFIFNELEHGVEIWAAMRESELLTEREVALLRAAQKAGNLGWALREMGTTVQLKNSHRLQLLIEWLRPVLFGGLGLLTGWTVIAVFLPIVKLINDLS